MLNEVTLIGRLGADVEMRIMPNGNPVATLSLATTRRWKDKQTGERKEETEWHRVTMFGKLAEIAGQYLKKGSLCYIKGRIKTTKWAKDGADHYSTGIIADQMIMLDGRPEGTQSNIRAGEAPGQGSTGQQNKPRQNNSQQGGQNMPPMPDYADFDDDIPF